MHGAGVELTLPGTIGGDPAGKSGNGLSVPGLGSLPKLDFGLELLYGASDQGPASGEQTDTLPNSLTLHGAVKKTF